MRKFFLSIQAFFFQSISASGFGMMRIAWATITLGFFLFKAPDVWWLYSNAGMVPVDDLSLITRIHDRFSILDIITKPEAVYALYILLILLLICCALGKWTRITTSLSVLLLFSFHERNGLPLNGGDTMLRVVGFLLLISPELRAFSLDRLGDQWKSWQKNKKLLPPLTMSIWPYRLLIWQLIVVYITSAWDKYLGDMWHDGTAIATALHHTHFAKWPKPVMDVLATYSSLPTHLTLVWQFLWVLLLTPRSVTQKLPLWIRRHSLKRILLFFGILFHGSIFILMNVGSFCFAMFTAYLGALQERDFSVLRTWFNRHTKDSVVILYDGQCSLCMRSVFLLSIADHLQRIRIVNLHDAAMRKKYAPAKTKNELLTSLHIRLPDGHLLDGFDAFRSLAGSLPTLWPLKPLLHLPGVAPIGRRVYQYIADRRPRCKDGSCKIVH